MSEIDLSAPSSLTRLTSTVLKFKCPEVGASSTRISFVKAFKTVGTEDAALKALKTADATRDYLVKSLNVKGRDTPHKTIANAAASYIPFMHQILLGCQVQPEAARLDTRLVFEWASGIEDKKRFFKSEALMYELVMAIATEGMATAGAATDECLNGNFLPACKSFKKAAGIMDFLAVTQLPQWMSNKGVADNNIPAEAQIGSCEAFAVLFLGIAQQMFVGTLLNKGGTPAWSLLAKLTLGISEYLEEYVQIMRSKAPKIKTKIDENFFVLMTFQIELQKGVSMYCHSRHYWEVEKDFGLAIAMLNQAKRSLRIRDNPTGRGLPEIKRGSPLMAVEKDLADYKQHMDVLLNAWESDNSKIYFEKVPLTLPAEKKLREGLRHMKADGYELEQVDPIPLTMPKKSMFKKGPAHNATIESDEALARQLQEQLNTEG